MKTAATHGSLSCYSCSRCNLTPAGRGCAQLAFAGVRRWLDWDPGLHMKRRVPARGTVLVRRVWSTPHLDAGGVGQIYICPQKVMVPPMKIAGSLLPKLLQASAVLLCGATCTPTNHYFGRAEHHPDSSPAQVHETCAPYLECAFPGHLLSCLKHEQTLDRHLCVHEVGYSPFYQLQSTRC